MRLPLDPGTGLLRENARMPVFGLPCDLNGDGAIDAADRSDDYRALPVRLRLEWRAGDRLRSYDLTLLLRE